MRILNLLFKFTHKLTSYHKLKFYIVPFGEPKTNLPFDFSQSKVLATKKGGARRAGSKKAKRMKSKDEGTCCVNVYGNMETMSSEEAKLNFLCLLQRSVFHDQAKALEGIIGKQTESTREKTNLEIPNIISRRRHFEELQQHQRLLDNEEITLLGILDSDGVISSPPRLVDFMVFMTRVSKVNLKIIQFLSQLSFLNILFL